MPKKQKRTKRLYTGFLNSKKTNLKIIKNVSSLLKINYSNFKHNIGIKFIPPGYATHEYEIAYQFRKNDKLRY